MDEVTYYLLYWACCLILFFATIVAIHIIQYTGRFFLMLWHRIKPIPSPVSFEQIPLPSVGPFDGRDVPCTCDHACGKHERQPESMRMGSVFLNVPVSKIPKTQIALYSVDFDGKLQRYLGVGVRIMDWFVVPYHIVKSEEVLAALVMKSDHNDAIKISTEKFDVIDGDVAAMKMSEATFSQLGLVKAPLSPIEGEMIVAVTSSTKEPQTSFGTLLNDKYVFGGVVYRGSTQNGFSGAAYMVGKAIAGIHLGGGQTNYGVSATYVLSLLQKPEDTAEWLQRVRRKRGPLRYQRSRFSPDEAIVFVNGRYYTVDMSLLDQDLEEQQTDTVPTNLEIPSRSVEVNLSDNFPPQYRDIAEPVVETVNNVTAELNSKNLEVAEQCSAEQAEQYLIKHAELISQLDEKVMILQSLQDSLSNRYREIEKMLTQIPKKDESREVLVRENEKLKKELSEVKQLKTSVNVEASSVKAVPKTVKQGKAKSERADILDKVLASGLVLDVLIKALEDRGLVTKVVVEPATNVETTPVSVEQPMKNKSTQPSPSTSRQ